MSKRALIIGITGQDGSYLAEFLMAKGYEVGLGFLKNAAIDQHIDIIQAISKHGDACRDRNTDHCKVKRDCCERATATAYI